MATKMDITDFATSDLVAELATRSNVDQDDLDEAFGYQRVISNGEMQKVYDLFHLGKEAEAIAECKRICQDVTGRIL